MFVAGAKLIENLKETVLVKMHLLVYIVNHNVQYDAEAGPLKRGTNTFPI